jgi:hypothetical protein
LRKTLASFFPAEKTRKERESRHPEPAPIPPFKGRDRFEPSYLPPIDGVFDVP